MVMRPALAGNARFPRRAGPGLQILFMLRPRFPEMRLTVDHAGQHMQPRCIDHLSGPGCFEVTEILDASGQHPHIDLLPAGRCHHRAVLNDQVEKFGHGQVPQ